MSQLCSISVQPLIELGPQPAAIWLSSHGYESRSTAHLNSFDIDASRKISYGFDFPNSSDSPEVVRRVDSARKKLSDSGFDTPITDDVTFEKLVQQELRDIQTGARCRIVADISSMSRSRIASLLLACASATLPGGSVLDIIYFPSTYVSHKHRYEPLEHFGPCHGRIAGWPADPDLPLALLIGLGTEPGRADGVVEVLEPDILALYMPSGDEDEYEIDLRSENRRVLEVRGEPVIYPLRDPPSTYASLLATANELAERSRLVIVPLGPKIFCAMSIAAALTIGPEVGVWKASAGRGVEMVDVQATGRPILMRMTFDNPDITEERS